MGIMHPNYTWNDKEFDIGLVKLSSPLKLSEYVQVSTTLLLRALAKIILSNYRFTIISV